MRQIISGEKLMAAITESRAEYKKGKTIKADSLADLAFIKIPPLTKGVGGFKPPYPQQ